MAIMRLTFGKESLWTICFAPPDRSNVFLCRWIVRQVAVKVFSIFLFVRFSQFSLSINKWITTNKKKRSLLFEPIGSQYEDHRQVRISAE